MPNIFMYFMGKGINKKEHFHKFLCSLEIDLYIRATYSLLFDYAYT